MAEVKIYFEEIKENFEIPPFKTTVSRTNIVKYAGAGGDFNPLHHDEEFAKAVGMPSVFAMGLMHGGYLPKILTDWAGAGTVRRYKARFKGMVWPKDELTCKGHVVKKYQEDGENLVECYLEVVNQKGEQAIVGDATLVIPSKV